MTAFPMPAEKFWTIIERVAEWHQDPDAQVWALRTALHELTLEDLISFEVAFRRYLNEAYTWDLWGAAYVVHRGCSDDCFEYGSYRGDAMPMSLRWPIPTPRRNWKCAPALLAYGSSRRSITLRLKSLRKGGEGDVRDYSEPEAGLGGPAPSGEPFEDDEHQLARRS